MKRVAIFASYSKDGIIPEYVLYYLQGLKMVVEEIVFVADSDVQPGEEDKLKGLVRYSKCGRHGCYDFGSYRIGFEWAEKNGVLDDADELILCNDSCYGPAYPFEKVFAEMNKKECDFWGMVESHEMKTHLQSYFLVFKKAVFQSSGFKEYVHSLGNNSFDKFVFEKYMEKTHKQYFKLRKKFFDPLDDYENLTKKNNTNTMKSNMAEIVLQYGDKTINRKFPKSTVFTNLKNLCVRLFKIDLPKRHPLVLGTIIYCPAGKFNSN